MANTIAKQTLNDGERNVVVKVTITGDGSGEESATKLIDVSDYTPRSLKLRALDSALTGFSAWLAWDATTDVKLVDIPEGKAFSDWEPFGGLINNAGTGITQDIMITTIGLGSGDVGSMTLEMVKK